MLVPLTILERVEDARAYVDRRLAEVSRRQFPQRGRPSPGKAAMRELGMEVADLINLRHLIEFVDRSAGRRPVPEKEEIHASIPEGEAS